MAISSLQNHILLFFLKFYQIIHANNSGWIHCLAAINSLKTYQSIIMGNNFLHKNFLLFKN